MLSPLKQRVAEVLARQKQQKSSPAADVEKGLIELFNELHESIVEQRSDDALRDLDAIVTALSLTEDVTFAVTN